MGNSGVALGQQQAPAEGEGSSSEPLHVVVVGPHGLGQPGAKPASKVFSPFDLLYSMMLVCLFSLLWLTGSALTRRYVVCPFYSPSSLSSLSLSHSHIRSKK